MDSISPTTQRPNDLMHRSSFRNLILLIYLVYGMLVSAILFGVPLRALNLGAGEVLLGGIVSGFVSTGLVFSFAGAALCDRLGERSLIISAFGFYALAYALGVLAQSPPLLVLSAFLAGVGDMLFTVGGMTYLTRLVRDRGKELPMSLAFSLLRLGSLVGVAGAGSLVESSGFQVIFIVGAFLSIVGALTAVILQQVVTEPRRTSARSEGVLGPFKAACDLFMSNETVRIAMVITCLGSAGWFTFRSSFYLDYLRRTGMSPGSMGFLTGLGSMGSIVAPFVYTLLSRRIEALRTVVIGLLIAGLGLAVTPLLRTSLLIGAVAIPAQMGDAFRLPGVYVLLGANTVVRDRPTAVAIVNSAFALAALVAGPLWGLVVRVTGLSTSFYVAGMATVVSALALYRIHARRRVGEELRSCSRVTGQRARKI